MGKLFEVVARVGGVEVLAPRRVFVDFFQGEPCVLIGGGAAKKRNAPVVIETTGEPVS